MHKQLYSRFLEADPERLHFAAHSHHPWPDATRQAQLQYWDDAAKYMDHKWDHIFGEVVPKAQQQVARIIGVASPENICFAPNTHDFVARLFSCLDSGKRNLRILSTDSEFHSFRRQLRRYLELPNVDAEIVSVEPFASFEERFSECAAQTPAYDLVFLSQVFFNSGFVVNNLEGVLESCLKSDALVVVDGYHAFMAVPFSLAKLEQRVFYLAGGYKYAQAGEGACFMYVPNNCQLRPLDTGWFAYYESLESPIEKIEKGGTPVDYSTHGHRFAGATFDPSGIYRLNAALDVLQQSGLSVQTIHAYVQELQKYFLTVLQRAKLSYLSLPQLVFDSLERHGHFFSFRTSKAPQICRALEQRKVITDYRGDILRFGFGLHQDKSDIDRLFARMLELQP